MSLDLPTYYLHAHRLSFQQALQTGAAAPFIIPWSIVGAFVVPVLYLSIPHRKRPWLYRLRWVVVGLMGVLNLGVLKTRTGSENYAVGYAIGLTVAWGMIWGTALVGMMDVQWDVARVQLRRRRTAKREEGGKREAVVDESVRGMREEEYYWEAYPEDESFLTRLGWVVSLYLSFRGVGWNFAIPSVPHPRPPSDPHGRETVDFSGMPITTKFGHSRSTTYRSFILSRLLQMSISYLILDLWTLTARYDPYFVPGPAPAPFHPLPPFLSALPPILLYPLRSLISLAGVLSALHLYLPLTQLISLHNPLITPSQRALFLYPSISGSPLSVLYHGLAGFWSSFWHQSFRLGFTAPTKHLIHLGVLPATTTTVTRLTGMGIAFFLSGVMHALGGHTSLPETTSLPGPMMFFLLQFVGIIIQRALGGAIARRFAALQRWKATANALFVIAWLHLTNHFLIEDMSHAAIWLFEPVPFSPLRMMGFGHHAEETWWRWDRTYTPRWDCSRQSWECGTRL
ncbi:membrane bound O-acyl transferase family-domain-containing protein [Podospora aff. communis PSN243]|uniref:Membrane bound O-acyl transferase family-domain-containing protein n=1 Tax=Podospora aff. communis PSN243 TaxID=3040156 RepID=A0AAV9H1F3_9PEZI|nr:membrane bound O-acyl transferase family-domain-containing protein [Podospora aff. communis PSN243]